MIRLLPPTASILAHEVNWLYLGLLIISFFVLVLVFGLMITFCVRYRRTSTTVRGTLPAKSWHFELAWTSATFLAFIGLFFWGAEVYLNTREPPAEIDRAPETRGD
ncbi:MAG: cytochrome c oxidase subunit II transmembrane domain-containing protein [Stellaceae bacterium]